MPKFNRSAGRRPAKRNVLFRTKAAGRKRPEESFGAQDFYAGGEGDSHRDRNAIRNIQGKITLRATSEGLATAEIPITTVPVR